MLPGQQEWDAQADGFDDEPDHGLADPITRTAWGELLAELLPPPPASVLDLGCGTGSLAVLLAERGHTVTGLDASPRMLEHARAKAAAAGVALELCHDDANAPHVAGGTVDVVAERHVLWAMTDPADAVRRWADLLAPGGRLVLVEGQWHTGAGLDPDLVVDLVRAAGLEPTLRDLPDPALWGGQIADRRYVVTGLR
ncbi:class I SAM-dependent methyltransferase [Nocardioides mangrovicus]|uniref:Class I SAM-dependent methyltransferase n=1 Tax=Nocardioides mangrovicus TaxID=2478913 RepID=A0A3L8P0A8_9ACTN|nr:class I SAM-dependent methyltransferase [Nocardioides mangrovicus]